MLRVFSKIPVLAGVGFLILVMGSAASDPSYSGLCLTGQGCRAIAQTPLSAFIGLKLWWWGAIWLSAIVMMDLWRKDWPWLNLPLKSAAILGFAASLALPAAGFGMTGSFCSWCLASNLVFVLISLRLLFNKEELESDHVVKEAPAYGIMLAGMMLMLSVSFWPRTSSCFELSFEDQKHLRAALGEEMTEDTILVFTDPACGHCHATVPSFVKKAKAAGRKVAALWTPVLPASLSGEVAMYGTIAHWQGYGEAFILKEHGPSALETTLQVAKEEFAADEKTLLRARGVVMSSLKLFKERKLKGTPSFAQIRNGKLCMDLDPRKLVPQQYLKQSACR